jgi:hypothetical protein
MRTTLLAHPVRRAVAAAGALLSLATAFATPLAAQRAPARASSDHATVADFTPYAGYMTFQRYLDGPLGTNVRGAAAPVVGGQLAMAISQSLSLVGNVAYSRGDLQIGLPILGGLDVGSRQSWLYDAAIEARFATGGASATAIVPFVQLGAGAITTKLGSAGVTTSSTNPAAVAGAGLDLSLGGTVGLRAMVKDYVGRYKSDEVAGMSVKSDIGHNFAATVGLRLSF